VPQVRGSEQPFRSRLLGFLGEHTDVWEPLAVQMYARGRSTRDVAAAFSFCDGSRFALPECGFLC
jgi:hypothetical protein